SIFRKSKINWFKIKLWTGYSFKNVKSLLNDSYTNDLITHLQNEAEKIRECAGTEDFKEGISAFLEKRKANYKGR
ncbi:MAG: enoyl-CoA hydratase-related protein, partial [Candidatus Thorarchaeota archaeon]